MELTSIKESVQKSAEAIASVIDIDVTVTDDKLVRIAGTGIYRSQLNEQVSNDGVFAHCIQSRKPYIVRNPKDEDVCKACSNKNCVEYAEIVCPIMYNQKIYGIIGLIAFSDSQKQKMLNNEYHILEFLEKMASLIAGQIIERERSNEIKLLISQLQTVMNIMEKSIIITDTNGDINYYNKNANEIFNIELLNIKNINQIFADIKDEKIYNQKSEFLSKEFVNKEFVYLTKRKQMRGILNSKVYFDETETHVVATIFIIEELSQIITSARNIISSNIITGFNNIIYMSSVMSDTINMAKCAANSDSNVLITGESGTGKELFARALHYGSSRKDEPFIAINCSAIPENLFESELFGYEEGAYTGALKGGHPGKFELANKGTLLLDEIGDMPLNLQPKLLRVLQDSKVMRIGGSRYINVDVRIIASTNCNLEEKVRNKEFREDLYYRLNVIPLVLPPLRERPEDITLLANYFLSKFSTKFNKLAFNITDKALELIKTYPWYGNVRELENAIEYAVNMTDTGFIDVKNLPLKIQNYKLNQCYCNSNKSNNILINNSHDVIDGVMTLEKLERTEIAKAIRLYGFNQDSIKIICEKLGISRATLYRKVKKYNIISNQILIND